MTSIQQAASIDPSQMRGCPMCQGRGYEDSMQNQAGGTWTLRGRRPMVPVCGLCRGGRVVYLDKICACGSAAVLYSQENQFWWCGREMCHAALKAQAIRQQNYARNKAGGGSGGCLP
jgi:hypothetical protein